MKPPLRGDLEDLPLRMMHLQVDERGYPVPWFVPIVDGKPEFRAMDVEKLVSAVKERRCWVCGDLLGGYMAFTIGPMCGVNRISAEPPSHRQCASWSARNCPFLSNPESIRREGGTEKICDNPAGVMLKRNPGVTLIWVTRQYQVIDDGSGKPLFAIGAAHEVEWWCRGRRATRAEVEESVATGLPSLRALAEKDGPEAVKTLNVLLGLLRAMMPPKDGTELGYDSRIF